MDAEPRSRQLILGLGAAVLAAAHVHAQRDPAMRGLPLVGDHLFAILSVVALVVGAAAVGRALLARVGPEPGSAVDALLFAAAVGLGALATMVLVVGALGGLRVWLLVPVVAGAAVLARRRLGELGSLARSAAVELRDLGRPLLLAVGVLGAASIVQALAPPTDYDSLMYHLEIPAEFLARGRIHLPDANPMHVAVIGLVHMLYLPLLALEVPAGPALLNVAFALGFALTLLATARHAFGASTGRLALALLWGSPIVVLVAVTPKVDVALAFYLALAHYALLRGWSAPAAAARWLALAGVLVGLAAAVKYLAFPYLVALVPLFAGVALRSAPDPRGRARALLVGAAAAAITVAPWLVKNVALFGAPLYPYFAQRIPAPWLVQLYGGTEFPAGIDSASVRPLSAVRESFNVADWFFAPQRLTPESEAARYRANPLFAVALLAVLLLRDPMVAWIAAPVVIYLAVLLLLGTSINLRYLIPAIGPLTLLAARVVDVGAARVGRAPLRRAIVGAIALVPLWASAAALAGRLAETRAGPHAAGLTSREEYHVSSPSAEIRGYASLTMRVNALVPDTGRVLLFFEGRGYGFAPRVLQDNVLTNWVYLDPVIAPPRCLERSGITHVLVGTGTLNYFRRRGLDPAVIHWDRFPEFAARCLEPVSALPSFELYRVKPPR